MQRVLGFALSLSLLFVGMATAAQAGFLYVLRNDAAGNQIYGFFVNETTGATALLAGFPVNTGGTGGILFENGQLTIDRKNNRLYAINDGSDTVIAYSIDSTTGALTAMPFPPIALEHSISWIELAVHPSGSPLFIGSFQGKGNSYAMTATTATLAQEQFLVGTVTESSVYSRDGNFFYVGGLDRVVGYSVNSTTGVFTPLSGSPYMIAGGPIGYAMDAQDRLFLMEYANTRLRVFQTISGTPTPVSGNPFTGLIQSVKSALHPNGSFYFIVSRSSGQVGSYRISGTGTATTLSPVTGSPFTTGGTSPNTLEINHAGTFLYVANATSRNLTTYSVNSTTGFLTSIALQPVDTLGTTGRVTGMDYIALVSVSGRVLTSGGRGVSSATVSLTDTSSNTLEARTNGSGYFRVAGVLAGETYTLTVRHKLFLFAQQSITVTDKLVDLVLTAEP